MTPESTLSAADAKPATDVAAAAESPAADLKGVAEPVAAGSDMKPARGSRLVEGERMTAGPRLAAATARVCPDRAALARLKPAAKPLAAAAAILLAVGVGYGAGHRGTAGEGGSSRALEAEMARLSAEIRGVKTSVDGFKAERDKTRGEILARQAQLSDKVDRLAQDSTTRLGRLGEQLERNGREIARLATLAERVERLEKGPGPAPVAQNTAPAPAGSGAPTPPAKPVAAATTSAPDVKETGSISEPKPAPDPRKTPIEGYFVRDFDEGFALIETRAGRYVEVAVGYVVPGIGRVEAIERRGRQWVVITPKGFIGER